MSSTLNKQQQELANSVLDWIERVINEKLVDKSDFHGSLKDGKVLLKLINAIGGLKLEPQKLNMPFSHRENITAFTKAARQLKVPEADLFETNDLYEAKNLKQVLQCLESLGRTSQTIKTYTGPSFGAKLAEKNVRDHSDKKDLGGTTFIEQELLKMNKEQQKLDEQYRTGKPGWNYK